MVNLMNSLPIYFRPVLEYIELMRVDGIILDRLEENTYKIWNNLYIQTADEATVASFEKWFNIVSMPGETLEYRRARILQKYNTIVPFSIEFLRNRLTELYGNDYTLSVSSSSNTLIVSVTSSRYGAIDLLYDVLLDIVPAHIEIIANQQVDNYISGKVYAAGTVSSVYIQDI